METKSRRQKRRDDSLPSLNAAIDALNLARETTNVKPAKDWFYAADTLLTTIRVSFLLVDRLPMSLGLGDQPIEAGCVKLGLACAGACQTLDLRMRGGGD